MLIKLKKQLKSLSDKNQAEILQRFFKTGKGEYGEGDVFLGVKVPLQRNVAKDYFEIELNDIQELLESNIHEYRYTSLVILYSKYKRAEDKKEIFDFYMKNAKRINNWDLVDTSAPYIAGDFLFDKPKDILYEFVKSNNLWKRRIAIMSTFGFIKKNDFVDAIKISEILLNDSHDLIHKAVGWMLREIGKRDVNVLIDFLNKHYKKMPRTMLRYSIEKFNEKKRKDYLLGLV
jgi:3-methyladenine DNA glycosylase AlkD